MLRRFISTLLLVLLFAAFANAQNKSSVSTGVAPPYDVVKSEQAPFLGVTNLNSRGFSYSSTSLTASQLFKYAAGTPATVTTVGAVQPNFLGMGDFANPTGTWKFYVMEQVAAPYTMYEVDTATGTMTSVGTPSGLTAGETPILLEWNHVNNTFYVISSTSSISSATLYSMNWTTKVCTPIGPANTTCPGLIAGGVTASGTAIVGIDLVTDNIWRIPLATGIPVVVGPSGYTANYGQDAGFDRSDWTLYWAACGGVVGLRTIDTATGVTTQIGTFPYTQVLATGFATFPGASIVHTPLPNTQNLAGPYVVNAQIIPQGSAITYGKIFWSRNNTTLTDSVTMTNSSGNNWTGNIPGNGVAATYRYDIKAIDALGRVVYHPGPPPASNLFIATATDTTKPVITHTPIGNTPLTNWPPTVTCTVTDPFGVDSAWVVWKIGSGANNRFNLAHGSGTTWSGAFPAGGVAIGNVISYKIIARDASTSLNKDSTALYPFTIINEITACIGTGTIQMGSASGPYNTYWYGNRTQFLWTAAEINAAGGLAATITKIGFQIVTVGGAAMSGFNINLQNTALTTMSGFVTTGWTNAYSGTYTVPGTGWQYVTLQTPYIWNGTSNLLIEVCFGNSSYTTATVVNGTTMTGMEYSEYHDISTACTTFLAPTVQTARANVCFVMNPLSSVNPIGNSLPTTYSLSQNYPNPFNPVTRINFAIPKQGLVNLKIYDVLGREVKTLVNEIKGTGSYSVDFNAAELSSGVYFYRLESNGFSDIKRMMLIK